MWIYLEEKLPVIENFHHVTDDEKEKYIAMIKKQKAALQESKAPILYGEGFFKVGSEFYDAKQAKGIRETYEKEQKANTPH